MFVFFLFYLIAFLFLVTFLLVRFDVTFALWQFGLGLFYFICIYLFFVIYMIVGTPCQSLVFEAANFILKLQPEVQCNVRSLDTGSSSLDAAKWNLLISFHFIKTLGAAVFSSLGSLNLLQRKATTSAPRCPVTVTATATAAVARGSTSPRRGAWSTDCTAGSTWRSCSVWTRAGTATESWCLSRGTSDRSGTR